LLPAWRRKTRQPFHFGLSAHVSRLGPACSGFFGAAKGVQRLRHPFQGLPELRGLMPVALFMQLPPDRDRPPDQVQRLRKVALLLDQEVFVLKRGGHVLAQITLTQIWAPGAHHGSTS
jgi:hypothetical protein